MKKIVIIGPESTGKSTLCEHLAKHYNTLWCPEYAREYLLEHGNKYTYDDLLIIAKGQIELEEKIIKSTKSNSLHPAHDPLLFIDTNMYVMKVWCEFVFGKCHQYILDQVAKRKYDLFLLCNTDLPWVKDELREYPDLVTRQKLFYIYKEIMKNQATPWIEVMGNNEERLQNAIAAVDGLLKN
ncbi:MAG: ATP-binding protein [Bacteroidia bacterium]|nr:ATP-binding protein [Bacteroidia bacterium]